MKGKSDFMTLLPGDVISTGTPGGVGLGMVDAIRFSRVLLLLALSVFINYLDRGNLSIAAPFLKNEFQLSATQLGFCCHPFFDLFIFSAGFRLAG